MRAVGIVAAGIVVSLPAASHTIWVGQTTLIPAVCLFLGWRMLREDRWIVAGVLLGIGTVKPQFMLMPLLWLVLERRPISVYVAIGVTALILAVPALAISGPIQTPIDWLHSMSEYKTHFAAQLGYKHVIGLPSLIVALGGPGVPALPTAIGITALLFIVRHRIDPNDYLAIMVAALPALVYGHDPDLVLLAPTVAALAVYASRIFSIAVCSLIFMGLLYVPARLIRVFDINLFEHWRTLALVALLLILTLVSFRSRRNDPTQSPALKAET